MLPNERRWALTAAYKYTGPKREHSVAAGSSVTVSWKPQLLCSPIRQRTRSSRCHRLNKIKGMWLDEKPYDQYFITIEPSEFLNEHGFRRNSNGIHWRDVWKFQIFDDSRHPQVRRIFRIMQIDSVIVNQRYRSEQKLMFNVNEMLH